MAKRPRSTFRNLAEYATIRGLECVFGHMPVRWALTCGRGLGLYIRLWDRRHRVVAEANAARALGLSPAEARRFVKRVYSNLGVTFIEGLIVPHILRRHDLADFCDFEGEEHLRAVLAKGRGAIVVTAHIGNWELAGFAAAKVAGSVLAVARPMDNPLLEKNARRLRERMGQTIVDRGPGGLRAVIRRLKEGGTVAMLIDQNHRKGPVFVPFFGKLAATVPSPAAIALKYDVPVVPAYTRRADKGFRHRLHFDPPFELIRTGDHKTDVEANTALFTRRIEHYVRQHPDQWLWLHRRWRRRPPEELQAEHESPNEPTTEGQRIP